MTAPRQRLQLAVDDRARPRTDRSFLRQVVRATLAHADRPELPVSLLLTDDAGIAALHHRYLGDPTPTDVMSFALDDAPAVGRSGRGRARGGVDAAAACRSAEVVVNVELAHRVARRHGHAARAELALYVVHGLLHVLGYDDVRARERARMRKAEQAVLQSLGLVVRAVDP